MRDYLQTLQDYRDREIEVLQNVNLKEVNEVMNVLENARLERRRIFICGNGGSAATASHYAVDFNKGVNMALLELNGHCSCDGKSSSERGTVIPLYNFECLSDNVPTLTAISNDVAYSEVFRFPLSIKMKEGDVIIGISGSGNSTNVINAFDYAKKHGGKVIAIVGYQGGKMKEMADYCVHVEIDDMQIAEDLHMVLDHMMMWVLSHSNN